MTARQEPSYFVFLAIFADKNDAYLTFLCTKRQKVLDITHELLSWYIEQRISYGFKYCGFTYTVSPTYDLYAATKV